MMTINSLLQRPHHGHHPTHQLEACIGILNTFIIAYYSSLLLKKKHSWSYILWVTESLLYIVLRFAQSGLWGPRRTFPSSPIAGCSQHPKTRQRPRRGALDPCQAPGLEATLSAILLGSVRRVLKWIRGSQSNRLAGHLNEGKWTQGGQGKAFKNLEIEFGVINTAGKW